MISKTKSSTETYLAILSIASLSYNDYILYYIVNVNPHCEMYKFAQNMVPRQHFNSQKSRKAKIEFSIELSQLETTVLIYNIFFPFSIFHILFLCHTSNCFHHYLHMSRWVLLIQRIALSNRCIYNTFQIGFCPMVSQFSCTRRGLLFSALWNLYKLQTRLVAVLYLLEWFYKCL